MAKQCVKLELGDKVAKLRLTLRGQKAIREKYPDDSVLTTIMDAVDDPEAMDLVLTQALTFDGNDNKIRSGEALYDLLVDNGYEGQEDFLGLMMDIAKGAGLVTQKDRDKLGRVISKQIRMGMERLENALDTPETLDALEEGEEVPENPLKTLDD